MDKRLKVDNAIPSWEIKFSSYKSLLAGRFPSQLNLQIFTIHQVESFRLEKIFKTIKSNSKKLTGKLEVYRTKITGRKTLNSRGWVSLEKNCSDGKSHDGEQAQNSPELICLTCRKTSTTKTPQTQVWFVEQLQLWILFFILQCYWWKVFKSAILKYHLFLTEFSGKAPMDFKETWRALVYVSEASSGGHTLIFDGDTTLPPTGRMSRTVVCFSTRGSIFPS